MDLSVIIPTLNNNEGLKYLLNFFKNKLYEVVVVDNKKKNLGFAGGVNKGAEDVKTKWMLILNDDIEFPTDPIQTLIQFAEKEKLDAVSPILRNPNGEVENFGYKLLSIGKIQLIKEAPRSKFQKTNKSKILNTK
ncbi:MAG: glycosyltransferase, partial [Candidatus Roizmanbacteria bacterium]|nr:glycosyltransferase [Candidatus Roizmanbacteria bacterium]